MQQSNNYQPEKRCPVCGKTIIGRSDKIFCCDDCRIYYNNGKMRENFHNAGNYNVLKKIERNCRYLSGRNATFLLKIILSISVMCKIMTTFAKQKVRQ
jgi:predicted nucleic acid-binding Zn ribbon protein